MNIYSIFKSNEILSKQPVLKNGTGGSSMLQNEVLPSHDPNKMRYFDRRRMCEVYFERHLDVMYARV